MTGDKTSSVSGGAARRSRGSLALRTFEAALGNDISIARRVQILNAGGRLPGGWRPVLAIGPYPSDTRARSGLMKKAKRVRARLAFVVQKHKATSLHYDFRLEIGGVMPSWSVPKGPTLDSGVRRLAMPTSDHSMEHRRFEGVLQADHGGGPVMIWDEGTYDPEVEVSKGVRSLVTGGEEAEEVAKKGLAEGNLKFFLYGRKLRGSFALVRTDGFGGLKQAWLLIKHRDQYSQPGYDANDFDFSAVSKKSLAEIAGQEDLDGSGSLRPGAGEKKGVGDHRHRADGHRSGRKKGQDVVDMRPDERD